MEDGRSLPVPACKFPVLLYYITNRTQFSGDEATRSRHLLDKIAEAARAGVDFIQLREKDLHTRELEALAQAAVRVIRESSPLKTHFLVNSRSDVAIACGAEGVHLRSNDISPSAVRAIWRRDAGTAFRERNSPVIGVSCHSIADVVRSASEQASFAVFAPVFEKPGNLEARLTGLEALQTACSQKIPVLALGGITLENASSCVQAGAAGVAGIRLFQDNSIARVVETLRR
jgi:thiamine-phosphate pyrophosphorylase